MKVYELVYYSYDWYEFCSLFGVFKTRKDCIERVKKQNTRGDLRRIANNQEEHEKYKDDGGSHFCIHEYDI